MHSERKLLQQLAPEIDADTLLRLVGVFQDLRKGYESGKLSYPYSLRGMTICSVDRFGLRGPFVSPCGVY